METYIDRIKKMKSKQKITNEQLSQRTGIPLGTLSKILAGMSDSPKLSNIVAICNVLGCSVEYVVSGAPENTNNYTLSSSEIRLIEQLRRLDSVGVSVVEAVVAAELKREPSVFKQNAESDIPALGSAKILPALPTGSSTVGRYTGECTSSGKRSLLLYELPVSAGPGVYLEGAQAESISIPKNEKTQTADYALRISGNSMEPKYHDGDILLVEQADEIEVGEFGIFLLDGSAFFKIYGGDRLLSLNESYGPILLKEYTDVRCKGRVVGRLRRK